VRRKRPWFQRLLSPVIGRGRALAHDQAGATAIEFGILALPFFTIIFAIVETSMVFFAGQILDSAVNDASRRLRTREAQSAGETAADFRASICENLFGLFDCADTDKLRIKVSEVSAFSGARPTGPMACNADKTECTWTLVESYNAGQAASVLLVEAYYKWPTIVNLPGFDLANLPDGTRLLSAVRVFRNEP